MWRQFLKDYFSFTRKERFGIISVVSVILLLIILPLFFPYFIKKEKTDSSQFAKEIAQLRLDTSSKKVYANKHSEEYYNDYSPANQKYSSKSEVFFFDPNTASIDEWRRLGVREKTANTIQKYISKGGKFYKPEDIKKIWGLSEKDAERLIPYVSIKEIKREYPQYEKKEFAEKVNYTAKNTIQKVDINSADTTQYIALPGIGSKLSKRIIAFREKLGGFYSIDQIGETYLLPDSTFQKIKPYLVVDSKAIKKMNINSASVEEMKSHPYLRYNTANAIFQYRQQHGRFNSVDEIKKIMTVDDDLYKKIYAYLTVE
ncbi:MAG: helix-hairpin-helix domain-containing protein [Ginsengibacter sp.]